MLDAVSAKAQDSDIFIAVAAVADYRPVEFAQQKIKKKADRMTIELVKNPDILAVVASLKEGPFTVGFAAETEDTVANARSKLSAKGVDVIAANNVAGEDGAFGSDDNSVTLVFQEGEKELARTDKYRLAVQIIENFVPVFNQHEKEN
jgi:phosphopantothenoylcysteine decarboxylase/phosphopantothenate--cysteine ligase